MMARPPRIDLGGYVYHVINRSKWSPIDDDKWWYNSRMNKRVFVGTGVLVASAVAMSALAQESTSTNLVDILASTTGESFVAEEPAITSATSASASETIDVSKEEAASTDAVAPEETSSAQEIIEEVQASDRILAALREYDAYYGITDEDLD
jgi:hypothetical protein